MDDKTREEILFAVNTVVENNDERLDRKFDRVHERIDPLVENVAKINGRLSLLPTYPDVDKKIATITKGALGKKDWIKIIGAIITLIAGALGINISLQ